MSQKIMNGIDGSQLWLHFNYTASVVSSLPTFSIVFETFENPLFVSRAGNNLSRYVSGENVKSPPELSLVDDVVSASSVRRKSFALKIQFKTKVHPLWD